MRRRRYSSSYFRSWAPYVPVASRRRQASALCKRLAAEGRELRPVELDGGRKIAKTFWGAAWSDNLERYSDYENRLPRGRTYVRNGSVIDLQIASGKVTALVSGSSVYEVAIDVEPLPAARWRSLCADCAGGIDSLVELLQGRFAKGVMEVLCRPGTGLFPEPKQITLRCSCPDWASMCKHVAAVLYGVGARLDEEPELLFVLRQVDAGELISASAGGVAAAAEGAGADGGVGELAGADLGAMFGIELVGSGGVGEEAREAAAGAAEASAAEAGLPEVARSARVTQPSAKPGGRSRPKGGDRAIAPSKKGRRGQAAAAASAPSQRAASAPSQRVKKQKQEPASPWITAAELRGRGIPNHVVQAWLNKGLVEHSGERGVYVRGPGTEALVAEYLRRRS